MVVDSSSDNSYYIRDGSGTIDFDLPQIVNNVPSNSLDFFYLVDDRSWLS